jgi:RNA recognition motif-containing protein
VYGLPTSTTEESLGELLSAFGTVHTPKIVKDFLSGECTGIAFAQMDDDDAQSAIAGLDGVKNKARPIRVGLHWPSNKGEGEKQ